MVVNMTQTHAHPEQAHPGRGRPDQPPQVIAGTRPRRSASAGEVVLAYLRLQAGVLTSLEPQVRSGQPDAVHQMRIATRRLCGTLGSFGSVIPRSQIGRAHV